jgi:hypothetical protein
MHAPKRGKRAAQRNNRETRPLSGKQPSRFANAG